MEYYFSIAVTSLSVLSVAIQSGPPIERGMPLTKATDSFFSGRGAGGLQTNVVPRKNAIVVVQWGL